MNCKQVREMLSEYIDNIIEYEDAKAIETHLNECEECRKEYEELLQLTSLLAELPEVELPESFDARLHEALVALKDDVNDAEFQPTVVPMRAAPGRKKFIKRMSSIAAIFVVGIFALTMYNNSDQLMRAADSDALEGQDLSGGYELSTTLYNDTEETVDDADKRSIAAEGENSNSSYKSVYDLTTDEIAPDSGMTDGSTEPADNVDYVTLDANGGNSGSDSEGEPVQNVANGDEETDGSVPDTDGTDAKDSTPPTTSGSAYGSRGNVTAYDKLMMLYSTDGAIFIGRDLTAVKFYTDLLDEELADIEFEITNCSKDEEGVWSFEIVTVSTDEEGNEIHERVLYHGQDGTLWTEETTTESAITTETAIEQ